MATAKNKTLLEHRLPLGILLIGIAVSFLAFHLSNRSIHRKNQVLFQRTVELLRPNVQRRIGQLEELGRGIQEYFSVRNVVNRSLWRSSTPFPHRAMQYPELTASGYIERVTTAGVPVWTARLRQEGGLPPDTLSLSDAPVHWLVKYGYPAAREKDWVGLDLTATGFFQKIWLSGQPTDVPFVQFDVSSPVTKKPCVLMLFPHYGLSRPVGWFFLDIDPSLLFKGASSNLPASFKLQIARDRRSAGLLSPAQEPPFYLPGSLKFGQEMTFTVFQSRHPFWVSGWIPPGNAPGSALPWLILSGGILASLFAAYLVWRLRSRGLRTEKIPKEQGRFLSALAGNLPGLVYRCANDRERTLLWVNDGCQDLTGFPSSDLTGAGRIGLDGFTHPDDRERVRKAIQDALKARKPFESTHRIVTAGHAVKWVLETGRGVPSPDGNLSALEGMVLDVTASRKSTDALQERERFLSTLMGSLPGMVFRCVNDRDWTLEFVSEGCRDLTGFPPEEFTGPVKRSLNDLLHPDDREALRSGVEKDLASKRPFVFNGRIKTAFGKEKWVYATGRGLYASDGKPLGLEGLFTDVTDHRKAEMALKESEERYRLLLENVPDAVFMFANLRFLYVNPAACRLLGAATPQDLAEKSVMDLIHPDDHALVRQRIQQFGSGTQKLPAVELRYVGLDGVTRHAEAHSMKVFFQGRDAILVAARDISQRHRADEALRKSLDFEKQLIETANAMVIGLDTKGQITLFNEAAEIISGYTREELKGRNWFETLVPRDRYPQVWVEFQRLMEGGLPGHFENPIITRQGEERFILWRNSEIREEERIVGTLSFGIDITDRKKSERALSQSQKEWEDTFNGMSDWVALLDPEGRILRSNHAAEALFGMDPKRICGKFCYEVVHGTKDWKPDCPFLRMRLSNQRETAEFPLKEGGPWVQVTVDPIRDPEGRTVRVVHIVRDITRRKQAEQALRDSEERFNLFMANSPEIAFIKDRDYRVVYVNEAFERYFGVRLADIRGKTDDAFLPKEAAKTIRKADEEVMASGLTGTIEESFPDAVGRVRHWLTQKFVLTDSQGRRYLGGTAIDITTQKEAEAETRTVMEVLKRNNRELQEFAFVASHDLQEPLRKVQSFGDFLAKELGAGLSDQASDYLKRMRNAATRMQVLIESLLDFSRITTKAQPFEPVDMAQVAREVLTDLEVSITESGANVEVGELPFLDADPTQMRQLIQNLVGNALKFRKKEVPPRVTIGATIDEKSNPPQYRLTVTDNGIGFEEKHLDRIFNIFQRLHGRDDYEGTGMGLAICRRIAERHGGTITAASEPGRGSVFTVRLPAIQPTRGDET